MNQAPPATAPKKRSGLIIAIIVGSVIAGIGVVVYTFIGMSRTFKELRTPYDAGPAMSDEEIKALLAGPKHDFVGKWENPTGMLVIGEDGRMGYAMQIGMGKESANGRISVFHDDAFYVSGFRFEIQEAPRRAATNGA